MRRQLCIAIRARVLAFIQQQGTIMSRRFWLLFLRGAVASACLLLGFTAQAGLWSADYDPPAYVGTATFEVPAACLSGVADGSYTQAGNLGCAPIEILSNISTLPAVDFASILPQNLCASCEYVVIGERFVGVNTGIIGSVFANDDVYWFEFLSTFDPGNNEDILPSVTNFVNLYNDCELNSDDVLTCAEPIFQADLVVFAAVPEPGSIGLILGALGAGWLARRRKAVA
jgi:hypothetical protein